MLFCTKCFSVCYIMLLATSPESLVVNLQELIFYGFLRIIFMQLLYEYINTNK